MIGIIDIGAGITDRDKLLSPGVDPIVVAPIGLAA